METSHNFKFKPKNLNLNSKFMNQKVLSMRTSRRPTTDIAIEKISKENKNPNAHLFFQNCQNQLNQYALVAKPKPNIKTPLVNISLIPHRKQSRCLYEQRIDSHKMRTKVSQPSITKPFQSNNPVETITGNKSTVRQSNFYLNSGFGGRSNIQTDRDSAIHSTYRGKRAESIYLNAESKHKSRPKFTSKNNINIFNPVINLNQSISIGCLHSKSSCPNNGTSRQHTHHAHHPTSVTNTSNCSIKQKQQPHLHPNSQKNANLQWNMTPSAFFSNQGQHLEEPSQESKRIIYKRPSQPSPTAPYTPKPKKISLVSNAQKPNFCFKYFRNIINYMIHKESVQQKISQNYITVQQDISERMKIILYDWMFCISEQFKLKERTLFLAFEFVELYMNGKYVCKDDFQLIGISCLFVASKYEEIYPPKIDEFCKSSDNYYTKMRIFEVEGELIKLLQFDVSRVIAYDFFLIFALTAQFDEKVTSFGVFLLSICTMESSLYYGSKSLMAFGLCYLLHKIFKTPSFFQKCELAGERLIKMNVCQGKFEEAKQTEDVQGQCSTSETFDLLFREDEIRECARSIFNANSKFTENECKYIYQKFKDQKFAGASKFLIIQKTSSFEK